MNDIWEAVEEWKRKNAPLLRMIQEYEAWLRSRQPQYETYTSDSTKPVRKVVLPDGNWYWEEVLGRDRRG